MKKRTILATLIVSTTLLPAIYNQSEVLADDNKDAISEKRKSGQIIKVNSNDKQVETYNKQPIAEYVEYNGQKIAMKHETTAIKEQRAAKVTAANNSKMGQEVLTKSRTQADSFYLGDSSRPRQDFVDVSSYQSRLTQEDFNYMKARGITGVVVKLTEGTSYRNPYASAQITMARNAGMKVSTYHFSRFANKAQAEAEADYYARYAQELGLDKNTLMVNDAESNELNNGYGTQNSVYFALRLIRTHNFTSVLHYMSGSWCGGVLDPDILGNDSLWIAAYPYSPSSNNLQYRNREAWQFSSTMRIPNYSGYLDVNIDYTGRFTNPISNEPSEMPLRNTYFRVWNGDGWTYNDRNITSRKQSTKTMQGNVFEARGYIEVNGARWYSLFDNQGNWYGWTHEYDLQSNPPEHQLTDTYATIWNGNGTTYWDTFITTPKEKLTNRVNETYEAKSYIEVDGAKWYSLFDADGNWHGWVHEYDLHLSKRNEIPVNQYFKVWNSNGRTYADRMLTYQKMLTTTMQNKVYQAKGYITINNAKWYSLFDEQGNWYGWTHEYDLKSEPTETPLNNLKVRIWNGDGTSYWDRFLTVPKQKLDNLAGKFGYAKGYIIVDGAKWYSVFDETDQWCGWIHEYDLNEAKEPIETPLQNTFVTIWNGNGTSYWDRFLTTPKQRLTNMANKTYEAKGYIEVDGAKWYSLFDEQDNWYGWVHEYDLQINKREVIQLNKVYFKLKNEQVKVYENLDNDTESRKNKKVDEILIAREKISEGDKIMYALDDQDGNFYGFVNEQDLIPVSNFQITSMVSRSSFPNSRSSQQD